MKRVTALLLALLLLWGLTVPVSGESGHAADTAGVLSSNDLQEIDAQAEEILAKYGVYPFFYITRTEEGNVYADLEDIAGQIETQADILMFGVDIGAGKWAVYADGRLADISESEEDSLYDRYAVATNYYGGARNYLTELEAICRTRFGGEAYPRLFDGADLLTDPEEEKLLQKLDEISARQDCDVVVVTTTGTHGYTVQEYADDFYDFHGYADDGVLLLISMAERDWYISTKGYGMTAINDDGWPYIGEEITPQLSDGDYYDAFAHFADLCDQFITQAKTDKPYTRSTLPKKPLSKSWIIIAAVIGLVVGGMVSSSMKGKLKSVRWQPNANQYLRQNSLHLTDSRDTFLYTTVTRTEIPRESSSRSGGGSHSSSSGSSHGGGGGKF